MSSATVTDRSLVVQSTWSPFSTVTKEKPSITSGSAVRSGSGTPHCSVTGGSPQAAVRVGSPVTGRRRTPLSSSSGSAFVRAAHAATPGRAPDDGPGTGTGPVGRGAGPVLEPEQAAAP